MPSVTPASIRVPVVIAFGNFPCQAFLKSVPLLANEVSQDGCADDRTSPQQACRFRSSQGPGWSQGLVF